MPTIKLSRDAELKLTAWAIATGNREFSGLGLIEREGTDIFHVVDVDLLGVGSVGFTEFAPERQRMLPLDERRKLWFHRHPIGSGEVGDPGNWSGTDEHTCTKEPLGGIPQLVRWSVAIVRTPGGWIGRVDIHVPKPVTFHCPVEPRFPTPETIAEAQQLITPELEAYIAELQAEYDAMHQRPVYRQYVASDFDVYDDPETGMMCLYCNTELKEEMEIADLLTGEMMPTYSCENCGEVFVLTSSVPKPEPAWKQTSWWQRIRGK